MIQLYTKNYYKRKGISNPSTHLVIKLGKSWISIDYTGIMGWFSLTGKNFYWIYNKQ